MNSFSNYFMIYTNMPFAPGCPLSPFNEYASVSKSGEKHRVVYSNQLVIADS